MELLNLPEEEISDLVQQVDRHLSEISRHDRGYLEDVGDRMPVEDPREIIREIVLAPEAVETSEPPISPEAEARAARLAEGSWVELTGTDGAKTRCRLATILGDGQRFIFVNRKGMKVAERSRRQLGTELQSGAATMLDEAEIFDKALQAVIGNLRHMRERSGTGTHA